MEVNYRMYSTASCVPQLPSDSYRCTCILLYICVCVCVHVTVCVHMHVLVCVCVHACVCVCRATKVLLPAIRRGSLVRRPHPLREGRSSAPSPNSWIVPRNEEHPIRLPLRP